jgi:two-component system, OmpR family, sensor histidine kinase KdpD
MEFMRGMDRRAVVRLVAVAVPALALATLAVKILQDGLGIPNPSAVYLVAVVATAFVSGTAGAVVSAIASFLLYDYLFVDPRYTFSVTDPGEYLSVILLLFVGIVVGQLAALQRSRTRDAQAREREAYALFRVSRSLATRDSTPQVLPELARALVDEAHMDRVQIWIGADDANERMAADSSADPRAPLTATYFVLRRTPGDEPADWVRVHAAKARTRPDSAAALDSYRIRMETTGQRFGSIWAQRPRNLGQPDRTETRLLAATADQVGQALAHDRLAAESQAAEIARQSDELKSALVQSVSHDLRTPLATIRAAAGSLRPTSGLSDADRTESVDAIDREVEYLNRMVTNLLDLSRIEAGALNAERDVFELDDLVGRSLERLRPRLTTHPLDVALGAPPVLVDPIFLDSAVTNVIENAIKYTPPDAPLHISAAHDGADKVRLTIEDGGPGVPDDASPRLFDKFYRVPGRRQTSRSGTGIGLAVVRGLVEAMGGQVSARRSDLGGLAIDIDVPAAPTAPSESAESAVPAVSAAPAAGETP